MSMRRWLCFVMHAVAERMKVQTNWRHSTHSLTALPQLGKMHWNLLLRLCPLSGESCAHHCTRFIGNSHSIAVKFR